MVTKKNQEVKINWFRNNSKYVKIIKQNSICDIVYLNFKPMFNIKKISKDEYIVVKRRYVDVEMQIGDRKITKQKEEIYSTGEVFKMEKKIGERNRRSLRKIFNEMKWLINTNFFNEESTATPAPLSAESGTPRTPVPIPRKNQLFITLTYAENMQDEKRLYKDFDLFMKRLKYKLKEHELCYIVIMEPQGRGAYHCHLLLKTLTQDSLYIKDAEIRELWGHGLTKTERLDNVNNIGSYFVAYMDSMPIDEEMIKKMGITEDDIKQKDGHKYIKGNRVDKYKEYTRIYRSSRNIIKPTILGRNHLDDILDEYGKCTYESLKEIDLGNDKTLKIAKEQRRK